MRGKVRVGGEGDDWSFAVLFKRFRTLLPGEPSTRRADSSAPNAGRNETGCGCRVHGDHNKCG